MNVLLIAGLSLVIGVGYPQAASPDVEFRQIGKLLGIRPGQTVADVGAGGGTWTRLLAGAVGEKGQVFSTEVKPELVEGLRNLKGRFDNVTPVLGTEESTGLPDGCCDAILLRLVYHAFDAPAKMRQSLGRAIRPSGRILIIDFPGGIGVKPDRVTRDMETAGFERIAFLDRWQGQEGVYAIVFQKK